MDGDQDFEETFVKMPAIENVDGSRKSNEGNTLGSRNAQSSSRPSE